MLTDWTVFVKMRFCGAPPGAAGPFMVYVCDPVTYDGEVRVMDPVTDEPVATV